MIKDEFKEAKQLAIEELKKKAGLLLENQINWKNEPFADNHLTCSKGKHCEWKRSSYGIFDVYLYPTGFQKEVLDKFDTNIIPYFENMFRTYLKSAIERDAIKYGLEKDPQKTAEAIVKLIVERGITIPPELHSSFQNLKIQL